MCEKKKEFRPFFKIIIIIIIIVVVFCNLKMFSFHIEFIHSKNFIITKRWRYLSSVVVVVVVVQCFFLFESWIVAKMKLFQYIPMITFPLFYSLFFNNLVMMMISFDTKKNFIFDSVAGMMAAAAAAGNILFHDHTS